MVTEHPTNSQFIIIVLHLLFPWFDPPLSIMQIPNFSFVNTIGRKLVQLRQFQSQWASDKISKQYIPWYSKLFQYEEI